MIGYPRWKIALVAIVLLLGIFLALPNLFGDENALQLAADRAAVTDGDRSAVEQILKDKGVTPIRRVFGAGSPHPAFQQQDGSVEGARHDCRGAPRSIHHRAVAGLAGTRRGCIGSDFSP